MAKMWNINGYAPLAHDVLTVLLKIEIKRRVIMVIFLQSYLIIGGSQMRQIFANF